MPEPKRRWFLPEMPDMMAMIADQLAVTIEGIDAFVAWAGGDAGAGARVHQLEHAADERKRAFQRTVRTAFITPIEPEDLFTLSQDIDRVLNQAKDLIGESEVMDCPPDEAVAEMAALTAEAMRAVADAVARLGPADGDPVQAAEAAVKLTRKIEKVYRRSMAALLENEDLREVMARREIYRRCSRIAEAVEDVAERVGYAVAKES